jgi:hypothetical protein
LKTNIFSQFISLFLLAACSFGTEPAKDGVYIAVEGNLLFVLTLDKHNPDQTAVTMYQLKEGEWRRVESRGVEQKDGRIIAPGTSFVIETTSGPGYSTQRIIQTEQSFSDLSATPMKINRRFSRVEVLNRDF